MGLGGYLTGRRHRRWRQGGEGGRRHCHRSPGEEDGIERRPWPDPVATDGARRCGANHRWETRGETATSSACAGNPSHRQERGENERRRRTLWLITPAVRLGLGCRTARLISPAPASPVSLPNRPVGLGLSAPTWIGTFYGATNLVCLRGDGLRGIVS